MTTVTTDAVMAIICAIEFKDFGGWNVSSGPDHKTFTFRDAGGVTFSVIMASSPQSNSPRYTFFVDTPENGQQRIYRAEYDAQVLTLSVTDSAAVQIPITGWCLE
jgi:hypothetical protein